jgi:hypothetical protein
MGCNAQSCHFKERPPMHVKRRLPNFESCSVALFASLAMGSTTLPARAQGAAPTFRTVTSTTPTPGPLALQRTVPRGESRAASGSAAPEPDGSISSPGFDEALK